MKDCFSNIAALFFLFSLNVSISSVPKKTKLLCVLRGSAWVKVCFCKIPWYTIKLQVACKETYQQPTLKWTPLPQNVEKLSPAPVRLGKFRVLPRWHNPKLNLQVSWCSWLRLLMHWWRFFSDSNVQWRKFSSNFFFTCILKFSWFPSFNVILISEWNSIPPLF